MNLLSKIHVLLGIIVKMLLLTMSGLAHACKDMITIP